MCGIVGILARGGKVAPEILERATLSLAHRGPDDHGTIILQECTPAPVEIGLGSRRLAILDLSPLGHQPMHDPETGNWIVYNGEIYNFREIRGKLEREGVQFQSQSDTEVLLKAYGRWGERCLNELRGMFAFAIWDTKRKRLFLARDPMGIKPLYYCSAGSYFLFASEVRTLLQTGIVKRRLDRAGLLNYLAFGSVCDPISLIEGVSALRPGHYLTWEEGSVGEVMYWDMVPECESSCAAPSSTERRKLEEEVQNALCESVRMQMVSDVPVGAFLSGGIDSSSLVGILSRGGVRLDTFSLVFREADYSEAEYSRMVAKKFGSTHHEILVTQQDALAAIPGALQAMDQPTIDGVNTYLVSLQTRAAGIKVALSGLGGDEVFAGYSSFQTVPRMERLANALQLLPQGLRRPLGDGFSHLVRETDQNRKLAALFRGNGSLVHPYFLSRLLFMPGQREKLFLARDSQTMERANLSQRENLHHACNLDPINRVSYLEARCYMLNTLLRDSDVMSMAHGLEARVPLIDHRLAQKALALPGAWKLDSHTPKPLLVAALRGELPDEIVYRRKRGFTFPFEHWLRGELRSGVEQTLRGVKGSPLGSLLDASAVWSVWEDFQHGKTSWSRPWSLYVLQRWCEAHSVTV